MDHTLRLRTIYDRILKLVDRYLPDEVAVEVPFLGQNVQSLRKLVRVEATVMLAAMHRELPVAQYARARGGRPRSRLRSWSARSSSWRTPARSTPRTR